MAAPTLPEARPYYIEACGRMLQVLGLLAAAEPDQRTRAGLLALAQAAGIDVSAYQIRSYLATLEAEGWVSSTELGGEAWYTVGPRLAAVTYTWFRQEEAQLRRVMARCQEALAGLPINPKESP